MTVTFAHMGSLHIVLSALLKNLGLKVLVPPPITKRTLELGTANAPETACLPFKINLGTYIQALAAGADTIVTCGGCGPCRIGYYAENQKNVLRELGYTYDIIVIEPELGSVWKALRRLGVDCGARQMYHAFRMALNKLSIIDHIERRICWARAREKTAGTADLLQASSLASLDAANDFGAIKAIMETFERQLADMELDSDRRPVRVGIIGEIFVALEPFANQQLIKRLGVMGVEVHQPQLLGDYVKAHLLKNSKALSLDEVLRKLALPYIGHYVGGHGAKNIGYAAQLGREGFDGFIHIFPFTCMPEVIAKNILPNVSADNCLPGLSLSFDEQTGLAGMLTRVEAFVDLLHFRRSQAARG